MVACFFLLDVKLGNPYWLGGDCSRAVNHDGIGAGVGVMVKS